MEDHLENYSSTGLQSPNKEILYRHSRARTTQRRTGCKTCSRIGSFLTSIPNVVKNGSSTRDVRLFFGDNKVITVTALVPN